MGRRQSASWRLKKRFWSGWHSLRFTLAKQRKISQPRATKRSIGTMPFSRVDHEIQLQKILVFDKLPRDEAALGMRVLTRLGLFLNRVVPPMTAGAPEIDLDIEKALDSSLSKSYRKHFRCPQLPAELGCAGMPELELLAIKSPYSVFIERGDDGRLQWDFKMLGSFEHQDGLRSLGVQVFFDESPDTHKIAATEVNSDEFGRVFRGGPNWEASKAVAICAATTHLALTRHFNYVHLIGANHWDVTVRNHLAPDHPVYRLVWPHIANGLYTNYGITRCQLLADGDFVNIYSFTHRGLLAYYDAMYERYRVTITDPVADWEHRGLGDATFHRPSQDNLVDLFTIMRNHAQRYLEVYYDSDEHLRADRTVRAWLAALDALIPNGISGLLGDRVTRDGLARLIGAFIYEGNTIHDLAGTTLWDYQLWADRNPTRVYRDGRRIPVDVFQRMVNNNFGLQLRRAPLLADYSYLALDVKGAAAFKRFYGDCQELQARYDTAEAGPWRMQPSQLEISMNG